MTLDASSAYRRTDGHSAGPIRLIIMLYEQLIKDLQRAIVAIEKRDIGCRTSELDHALKVVGQLQGSLDMEKGGEVANNLDNYYHTLRASLLQAQISASPVELHKQIRLLLELRETWVHVERSAQGTDEPIASRASMVQTSLEKPLGWSI